MWASSHDLHLSVCSHGHGLVLVGWSCPLFSCQAACTVKVPETNRSQVRWCWFELLLQEEARFLLKMTNFRVPRNAFDRAWLWLLLPYYLSSSPVSQVPYLNWESPNYVAQTAQVFRKTAMLILLLSCLFILLRIQDSRKLSEVIADKLIRDFRAKGKTKILEW